MIGMLPDTTSSPDARRRSFSPIPFSGPSTGAAMSPVRPRATRSWRTRPDARPCSTQSSDAPWRWTTAVGIGPYIQKRHTVLWDGSTHDISELKEANDLADDGTIAGSIDFDGYFAGRTSDSYVFGFHAAVYSGGQAQDLNLVTDTSG